jgi:3-keto-5-aminohexanoate cleavage enzyme
VATEVMIMVAPNGARKTKADHPQIPITPEELAQEAVKCVSAGASALHMHVRDKNDGHVLDAARYLEVLASAKPVASGAILQITTEAVGIFSPDEQMQCVRDVAPESVSIALKELIPDARSESVAQKFLNELEDAGCSVQFICYDGDDVKRFLELRGRGIIPQRHPFLLFVLGRYSVGQRSQPSDLDPFVEAISGHDVAWAMCAFGKQECACALHAARLGGHIRIGFENNVLLPDGTEAPDNASLIDATVNELRHHDFIPMSVAGARELLGLPQAASLSSE